MTLTPLAPQQGLQPQAVPSLPDIPPPMQTAASPPIYQSGVAAGFQQAYNVMNPVVDQVHAGVNMSMASPPPEAYHSGPTYVVPLSATPGTWTGPIDNGGGGGSNWQPGPNATPYNQGVDQGPQTGSPGPYADTQPIPVTIGTAPPGNSGYPVNPPPMSNTPYSVGPNDPSGLQPFTDQGTGPGGVPVAPPSTPYNYATPGSEVPIIDTSVPGASFDGGGGGGD